MRAVVAACVLILLAGCSAARANEDTVVVMAAASLTDAFAEIVETFEANYPELDVQLNLAGSASLREQILQGAPGDVFASADEKTMQVIVDASESATQPAVFATNQLEIAVPRGNPAALQSVDDLADPDLLIGLCAAGVPCGDFARASLANVGVTPAIDTNEPDVRALLTKIEADELDAGIVYSTDILASPKVDGIALPTGASLDIRYPIVVLAQAPNPEPAALFVDFVLGEQGRTILASHGFGLPDE